MKKLIFIIYIGLSLNVFGETIDDAYRHMVKEDYDKAIPILKNLIEREPEYIIAMNNLGYCYWKLGKNQEAIQVYKKSYELSESKDAAKGLQWAYLANKQYSESIEYGEKALDIDPNDYNAELGVAEAEFANEKYRSALVRFKNLENKHGRNEYLGYKQGLCYFYLGDDVSSEKEFQAVYEDNPKSKTIRSALGLPKSNPYIYITPEYSYFNFFGSDVIGQGERKGINTNFGFNDSFSFRLSYHNSVSDNLYRTRGIENYLLSDLNLLQYGLYRFNQSSIASYINLPGNLYNLASIASQKDYVINYFDGSVSYKPSLSERYTLSVYNARGNSDFIGNALAVKIGADYGTVFRYGFSVNSISMPNHSGSQAEVHFTIPFLINFYSHTIIIGQQLTRVVTNYNLIFINPVTTIPSQEKKSETNGLFQQEFGYTYGTYSLGLGGKIGNARTPVIGDNFIYTPFVLNYGVYTYLNKNFFENYSFNIQYSRDKWTDSLDEPTVSDFIKFSLTARVE
ncbi:MAG: tetratricopeptide repeat protein [Leptospiraceae bacterium]|nr:tetratricopeptide repeat protein [Leptospiraceae bacterium]